MSGSSGMLGKLPNALSIGRICASPLISVYLLRGDVEYAMPLFAAAAASDYLDGWLVRKYSLQTPLGSFLDPFADKTLVACTVGPLMYLGAIQPWIAGLVLSRDAVLIAGSAYYRYQSLAAEKIKITWKRFFLVADDEKHIVEASMLSKFNTALQFVWICGCIITSQGSTEILSIEQVHTLGYCVVGTTMLSGLDYVYRSGIRKRSLR